MRDTLNTGFLRASQKNCNPADSGYDPLDPDNQFCDFFYFSSDASDSNDCQGPGRLIWQSGVVLTPDQLRAEMSPRSLAVFDYN